MNLSVDDKTAYMREALVEAQKAADNEEVPIGAVIVFEGQIIGRGYNRRERDKKATHHAELLAISEANESLGNWRLLDCALFVTVEPCIMCAGAINLARIPKVYYGAANPKFGAIESLYQILTDKRLNHRVEIESGILEADCADLMQNFFRKRR